MSRITPSAPAPSTGSGQALDTRLAPLLGMRGSERTARAFFSLPRLPRTAVRGKRGRAGVGGRLFARRAFAGLCPPLAPARKRGRSFPAGMDGFRRLSGTMAGSAPAAGRRPMLRSCNMSRKSASGGLRARRGTGRMALLSNPGRLLPEGIRNEESTSERRPHNRHYGKLLRLSKGGAAPLQHQRRPGRPQRKEGRGYGP